VNDLDDTGMTPSQPVQPPPAVIEPRTPMRLTGLRGILNARRIERKVIAREIDIDLNRFLGIVGGQTRAAPNEVEKLVQHLNVSTDELLAPDTTPRQPRRPANPHAPFSAAEDEPYDPETLEEPVERTEPQSSPVVAKLPIGDVTLNIALPDGRKYAVSSNQTMSAQMLQRMTQALYVLASGD
jgi:hypothetical protein